MEQEKLAKEKEEREKAEREKKLKEGYGFDETSNQWQKDKDTISSMAKEQRERAEEAEANAADTAAKPEQSKTVQGAGKVSQGEDDLRKKQP